MGIVDLDGLPEGLIINNPETALQKLQRFAIDGYPALKVVTDYDRTLTRGVPGVNFTTWDVLCTLLPADRQVTYHKLTDRYQGPEFAGRLPLEEAIIWWSDSLDLFIGTLTAQAIRDIAAQTMLRDGVIEMFRVCNMHNIPSVVLSAGVHDLIDATLAQRKVTPTAILATKLVMDKTGLVCAWDQATLVHILNKKELGHDTVASLREKHPNTILIGDSPEDPGMVEGDERVFRIRVHDPNIDDPAMAVYIERSACAGYDAVVMGDVLPIAELIEWIGRGGKPLPSLSVKTRQPINEPLS